MGLGQHYRQRALAAGAGALRPEPAERRDLARPIVTKPDGSRELTLAVDGLQCGACVWLIELLISIGIWAGQDSAIGPATLPLLHWVSALIAMPAIAYAGWPFFTSALAALRQRRTNMDVPVSPGVVLVTGINPTETINRGAHTYFDSAVTLLFFLLVGRVLDHRARGQARATAEQLLALRATHVAVVKPDGTIRRCGQEQVAEGDLVLVAGGERIGVDGAAVPLWTPVW